MIAAEKPSSMLSACLQSFERFYHAGQLSNLSYPILTPDFTQRNQYVRASRDDRAKPNDAKLDPEPVNVRPIRDNPSSRHWRAGIGSALPMFRNFAIPPASQVWFVLQNLMLTPQLTRRIGFVLRFRLRSVGLGSFFRGGFVLSKFRRQPPPSRRRSHPLGFVLQNFPSQPPARQKIHRLAQKSPTSATTTPPCV